MVVATAAGLLGLLAVASVLALGGLGEAGEWRLFVWGWVLAPSTGLGVALLTERALRRNADDRAAAAQGIAALDALWVLAGVVVLALTDAGPIARIAILVLAPATHAVALTRAAQPWLSRLAASAPLDTAAPLLLSSALVIAAASGDALDAPLGAWLGVVAAIAALEAMRRRPRLRGARWLGWLGLCAMALFLIDPRFPFDPFHHNWYVGPANAIRHGRVMLGDVVSAYGVLSIEFVGWMLTHALPFSYVGLSILVTGALLLQMVGLHALLRAILDSRIWLWSALFLALAVNAGGGKVGLTWHPSAGPLRFGLPYLLPLLVWLAATRPRWARPCLAAEGLVLGVCALWDLPTAVSAFGAWIGCVGYAAAVSARSDRTWLPLALRRAVWGLLCIGLVFATQALDVRAASGEWPRWHWFPDFMRAYAPAQGGLALGRAPALGGWVAIAAVYLASLVGLVMALAAAPDRRRDLRMTLVCALTLMGIAQLSYYVGWSFHSRLIKVAIPAVLVGAFWMERAAAAAPARRASLAWVACGWLAAGAIALEHTRPMGRWIGDSVWGTWLRASDDERLAPRGCPSLGHCLVRGYPVFPSTRATLRLLPKYAPDADRLAVFLGSNATTELGMIAGRAHVFPLTDASHDNVPAWNADRIAAADHGLRVGDYVFADRPALAFEKPPVANTVPDGEALLQRLLDRVCGEFTCVEVDRLGRVSVERLDPGPSVDAPASDVTRD